VFGSFDFWRGFVYGVTAASGLFFGVGIAAIVAEERGKRGKRGRGKH
jgi:hypothetical protein